MKLVEERGSLVGALVCDTEDQIFAIASNGVVIRTRVDQIRPSGRDTMGVTMMKLAEGDTVVAVARAGDSEDGDSEAYEADAPDAESSDTEQTAAPEAAQGADA
jgi:DNA gyrase subunit A